MSPATPDDTSPLARLLLEAWDRGRAIAPPSHRLPGFDIPRALRAASAVSALRAARGERRVGRKIGFTNRSIWALYNVDAPIWGEMWDTTVTRLEAGTHAEVSLDRLVEPRIEPEIVLGLRAAPRSADPRDVAEAIGWVAHGFELVQSPMPGWRFSAADAMAVGGLHARLVVGPPVPVDAVDGGDRSRLAERLAALQVRMWCEDAGADYRDGPEASASNPPVYAGRGADALDSPVHALAHLVAALARHGGRPLEAGEIVTTGTLTDAQPVARGQAWCSAIEGVPLPGLTLRLR